MSTPFKRRHCSRCDEELCFQESDPCERCQDVEIDEEVLTREQLNKRPPIVNVEIEG